MYNLINVHYKMNLFSHFYVGEIYMIKQKVRSSLELLNNAKSRMTLLIKDLIDHLLKMLNSEYCENLCEFKKLCMYLKNNGIDDVSTFIAQNILDYNFYINTASKETSVNIEFIFKKDFPINSLKIMDLKL